MTVSPEVLAAGLSSIAVLGAAVIAAVPAVWALLRRARGAVEAEGVATRAATSDAMTALDARLTAWKDEVRVDIAEVREGVTHVREWQAGHDAEHMLIGRHRPTE